MKNTEANAQIHRARIVVPVCAPPMEDGAVLVEGGLVRAVGKFRQLKRSLSKKVSLKDHGESIIMPPLVNCHTHLGLSWLKGRIQKGLGFSSWLRKIVSLLHEEGEKMSEKELLYWTEYGRELSKACGTGLLAEVTNQISFLTNFLNFFYNYPFIHLFIEKLHPEKGPPELRSRTSDSNLPATRWSFSAHSVYTCSRDALRAIKKWCRKRGLPFSIHVSESLEELEFVRSAKGPIFSILEERGRNVKEFFSCSKTPITLLEEEGILDENTICVHCTFASKKDLETIANKESWICLCPLSNEYICGTVPRADLIFSMTKRVCIGTDSLASNDSLSIFSELRAINSRYPSIGPERLIEAATLGGARALGLCQMIGSIEQGKKANLLVIKETDCTPKNVCEFICSEPIEERIKTVGS